MQRGQIEVADALRSFWLVPAPQRQAPLLVVLHGTGSTGKHMAAITELAERGPAAGFATVFPDGLGKVWDGGRPLPGREGIDDAAFLSELVGRLISDGTARPNALMLVGMSNGAFFAEYLARRGVLAVRGVVLVAGTATAHSAASAPARPTALLCFEGTADPVVPYEGGPIGADGALGRVLTRLAVKRGEMGASRVAIAAEDLAASWAAVNGSSSAPRRVEQLPRSPGELAVTKLSWVGPGPDCPPVVLYRVEGGGHTWPGGPQYLPAELIGPVAHHLDATGILLDMVPAALR